MNSIALSIGLSALSGFGDVEFHGVGQTAVSVVDDVEILGWRGPFQGKNKSYQ